jgi:hypothetical protein
LEKEARGWLTFRDAELMRKDGGVRELMSVYGSGRERVEGRKVFIFLKRLFLVITS